jgi:hypothetical protein
MHAQEHQPDRRNPDDPTALLGEHPQEVEIHRSSRAPDPGDPNSPFVRTTTVALVAFLHKKNVGSSSLAA